MTTGLIEPTAADLRLLLDEREITRTLHRYAHAVDHALPAQFLDVFMPDGIFEFRSRLEPDQVPLRGGERTPTGVIWKGREALTSFISQHTGPPTTYHKHVVAVPLIEVNGNTAKSECYIFMMIDREGRRDMLTFGRYLDELERCPDGRWRFTRRIADIESRDSVGSLATLK